MQELQLQKIFNMVKGNKRLILVKQGFGKISVNFFDSDKQQGYELHTDLHGPGASRRVRAHLEQASLCRFGLTSLPGRTSLIHHHGLSTKQTHEVCRLLTLNHTHLRNTQSNPTQIYWS